MSLFLSEHAATPTEITWTACHAYGLRYIDQFHVGTKEVYDVCAVVSVAFHRLARENIYILLLSRISSFLSTAL
jgi:hypothetical protein